MEYQATIGLEIHAELRTKTKMFCASKNDPDEKHPNVNICPVCIGHPGTLPVINEEAVKLVHKVGLALGGEIQKFSRFDRKNYFYPDLPKGYQISQYKHPLVLGGNLKGVRITRIHLEEDAGKLIHDPNGKFSLVDFNRAGLPLMELVTEPDIKSAKEAKNFAEELQLVLQYLGASDANMEKGQMRCEANVSVMKVPHGKTLGVFGDSTPSVEESGASLGTKVEVKNLNSFRAVERAIDYEVKRQIELLESGKKVAQETRGWNENKEETFSQRSKESAHDYRYFPEPDLPPMEFTNEYIEELRAEIPELPEQKRNRLAEEYKLDAKAVEILVKDRGLSAFWEKVASELREWLSGKTLPGGKKPGFLAVSKPGFEELGSVEEESYKLAANYFTSDFLGLIKEKEIPPDELLVDPENFAELIKMIIKKEITSRVAKDVLRVMVEQGGDPSTWVEKMGLGQVSDSAQLEAIVKKVISENQKAVEDFKKGKQQSLQFLVGQVMKETKGAANPEVIRTLLTKIIGGV
ncbi:glutaminyl-tRNA synthase (glutamine-hydrolyzing) subunit B [Candidatus Giovannonibacteria bacterium RIFCSPLOWO2_01_FULL_44_40]|uniref:Aspartyl/glutamyl-tRNA(Asn/Gln) amidotransferase subunit B n=1 Tax=Candidatus Giovannonibacteria bacterium RIFCSPHIGHO2_01_FULL_45_23 TaxID=1798325 RepID=A0A1F5VF37_9BACT|nr:MAG: glutaminyl-tRNA synthase (glutamine-hydrolyzing) subunit B [Candidatus Giovannonibacteria bacterium RIFCSPHIGHO2_01_FULL_45_23]OGF75121.1 MAG: glutaminyl-tRNA synthase (glutamine-hydrolyzing) subunit B [Candidatus Giovannonibacteria bacterium RIFCSPHIGHO2_02_FULL_45_13]OGF79686.1 MAG: glutaminyl-tRNA synthase (glutamine-hydrolyzing) subunit B [Candidatus Giovannonibacteria bacterium RIFCSPLOWO2_01_FULL_44_40]